MQRSYRSAFPNPLDDLRGRCRFGVISPRALFAVMLAAVAVVSIGAAWWWAGRREPPPDTSLTDPVVKALKPPYPSNLDDFRPGMAATIRRMLVKVNASLDDAVVWRELAVLYDAHHLYELAEQVYERAVQLDTSAARSWYGLAYVRGVLGDLEGACAAMDHVRSLHEDSIQAHFRVGLWKMELGDLEAAEAAFQRAAAVDEQDSLGRIGLARLSLRCQQWERAVELLEPIASGGETNARYARQLLGRAYRGLGRDEDAAAASVGGVGAGLDLQEPWRQEVEESRMFVYPTVAEANRLVARRRPDEAAALIDGLWEQRPDEVALLKAMAITYRNAGRFDKSATVLTDALSQRPTYYPAHLEMARTLAAMEDRAEEAMAHLDRALELNSTYAAAHALRGKLLLRQGALADAAAAYHEAARCEPAGMQYRYAAALTEMRLGRWDVAIGDLEVITKRSPGEARVFRHLGIAYLNLDRLQDAESALMRALELAPSDRQTQAALRRLEIRKRAP